MPVPLSSHVEAQVVDLYRSGLTVGRVAAEVGIVKSAVSNVLRRQGEPTRPRGGHLKVAPETEAKILVLALSDMTLREIAAEAGVTHGFVSKVLARNGRAATRPPAAHRKKLAADTRKLIAEAYQEGATIRSICDDFAVSDSIVVSCMKEFGVGGRSGWTGYRTAPWTDVRGRTFVFRSSWERLYAEWMDRSGIRWDFEPTAFRLQVCKRYTPDFLVNGRYVEVKGWLNDRTIARLLEFRALYPADFAKLDIIGPREMVALGLLPRYYLKHPQADVVSRFQQFSNS